MKISTDESKWDKEDFNVHFEGFPNVDGDPVFVFTYYQWCAFFFLMQV